MDIITLFIILVIIILLYFSSCFVVYLTLINNIQFWKRGASTFSAFPTELSFMEHPKRAYYVAKHPEHRGWAIILHHFGAKSDVMTTSGKIYWDAKLSLVFLDARGHGLSAYTKESSVYWYYNDAKDLVDHLNLQNDDIKVMHGISVGGFACVFLAQDVKTKILIIEGISALLSPIYKDILSYTPFPGWLYFWLPKILFYRRRHWSWEEHEPKNILATLHIPFFIILGEQDEIYPVEKNLPVFKEIVSKKENRSLWIVPGSSHSTMHTHGEYVHKIKLFMENHLELHMMVKEI